MTSDDDYDNNEYGIESLAPITYKIGRDDVGGNQVDLEWYSALDMNNPIGSNAMKQTFDLGLDMSKIRTKTPNEADANSIYHIFLGWWQYMIDVAKSAPMDRETELTEAQKFAVALISGVPIEKAEFVDGKYTVTLAPCAVAWDGRKMQVFCKEKGGE